MLYKGNIIHTIDKDTFEVFEKGYLMVQDGTIKEVGYDLHNKYPNEIVKDFEDHLIIPSFTDLHFHAVQYGNLGIGLDEELLDWLDMYTFKEEEKFSDLAYAKRIFDAAITHVIQSGTTRIVFFSSIHEAAAKLLVELCQGYGLTAFVGKVNMDRNASEGLQENTQQSIDITKRLLDIGDEFVKTIVTPRFVPSCTEDLMASLGELAKDDYPVQTHISENENEIEWVKSLHPDAQDYLDVYEQAGLIGKRTILAHCVFCTPDEKERIKRSGAYVAHCPTANFNLTSGIMDAKDYINRGIPIGFGTDVGAGQTPSIRQVMVHAIQMSKVNRMLDHHKEVISFSEAFYMATKGGGTYFGNCGNFEEGASADFLIIQPDKLAKVRNITVEEQLQRFIYSGNNNMIRYIYNRGNLLNSY